MKGLILGKSTILSKEVRYKENKDIIFVAPTKTGYEEKIVIANLIKNNENMIVFDKQLEYYSQVDSVRLNKGFIPHILTISEETNINDVQDFYKDKFTIYINYIKIYIEQDEIKKAKIIKNLFDVVDYIFSKVKEKNISCLSFINEYPELFELKLEFSNYLCPNNRFVFQVPSLSSITFHNKFSKSKIDVSDFTVFSTVKDKNILRDRNTEILKDFTYRNKRVLFYSVKIDKENDRILVI